MASVLSDLLTPLAESGPCGYQPGGIVAMEPTALATIALAAAGNETARANADWLAARQAATGTLGVTIHEDSPNWPTGWAIIAWQATMRAFPSADYRKCIALAQQWIVGVSGAPMHAVPELGHNPALAGWPWVEGTDSWVEPTAIAALALTAAGQRAHPRAEEARKLLYDRQLPSGGWNYGNTVVLGQELLPHVQPTGLALLALRGVPDTKQQLSSGTRYLLKTIDQTSTSASLGFAVLGLAAQGAAPSVAKNWIRQAAGRTLAGDRYPYKLAILSLAEQAMNGRLLGDVYDG